MKTRTFIPAVIALLLLSASVHAAEPYELLLSEVLVTPTEGEYIEIFNPNAFAVDLSNVYITDATYAPGGSFYFKIVTGDADDAGGAGGYYDFHARFPDGSSIGAGEYQTVAIAGSAGFFSVFGEMPTYELFEEEGTADAIPDMREALPGSIDFANAGLTNSCEPVILYYWDGSTDLVVDLDYLIWGSSSTVIQEKAIDKTGVTIDGPDAGSTPSAYLNDTAVSSQQHIVDSNGHTFGMSWTRIDESEGTETPTGGNGVSGEDETSENMNVTFAERTPSPNTGFLGTVGVSVADSSITEGNSGTQLMNFTISLTEAAPAGGVAVQVDTTDGTATSGSDYVAIGGVVK